MRRSFAIYFLPKVLFAFLSFCSCLAVAGGTDNQPPPPPAFADQLYLNNSVTLLHENQTLLYAFQSSRDCLMWEVVPGTLVGSGNFEQSTGMSSAKIGGNTFFGLTTMLEMTTASAMSDENMAALRQLISKSKYVTTGPCAGKMKSPDDIFLNPAFVQLGGFDVTHPNYYLETALPFIRQGPNIYFTPSDPTIDLTFDASDPTTPSRLSELVAKSDVRDNFVKVGSVYFAVQGILSNVKAEMKVDGNFEAEFVSAINSAGCTTSRHDGNTVSTIAGYLAAGPAGAAVGNLMGDHDDTITCRTQLDTNFKGGQAEIDSKIDFISGVFQYNGKPIMVEDMDDNNKAYMIPLQTYVKRILWEQLLQTDFSLRLTDLANSTFAITAGKNGKAVTKFNFDSEYDLRTNGSVAYPATIYLSSLDRNSLNLSDFSEPMVKCAEAHYLDQREKYNLSGSNYLTPVRPDCLK